jgi:signal transduction histidine kinase
METAYLLGVADADGFTAAFAFFTCAFFTFFVVAALLGAGAVVLCAFGAANMATADNRVIPINFFIFFSPLLWRISLPAHNPTFVENALHHNRLDWGFSLKKLNERIVMMHIREIRIRAQWHRVVVAGILFSAVLLLSAVFVAWRTVRQIDLRAAQFSERETAAKQAIESLEQKQHELNERWLQLARKKDFVRREEILDQLAQSRQQMTTSLETAYEQGELLRESVYEEGHRLLRWTTWTFAGCVGLWLVCAVWAVNASTVLFRRLEQQAAALTRLQFQFLESQENTARRFSHELHDELGQALTAVKANLSALRTQNEPERVDDCMKLVDQAINDVREMSQLLRPTMLDDFGLDAALRALTESFAQRTGITLDYQSNLAAERLPDQVETNLFRIAQESLTNIARHANAEKVGVELARRNGLVTLRIRDNGKGMEMARRKGQKETLASGGMGLAGMETRAQACGGRLTVESAPGEGMKVEVACPIEA